MKELKGNLWDLSIGNILCITTNGFVKNDGSCVMGKGIAAEAVKRFPGIQHTLGKLIKKNGNIVQPIGVYGNYILVAFPVKPISSYTSEVVGHMKSKFSPKDNKPGWACIADINIIKESVKQLRGLFDAINIKVYLPRPGCGAGELTWKEVKPLMENLPDKYFVCTF